MVNRPVETGDHDVSLPPRTVKPCNRTRQVLPIVAVGRDNYLAESGETGTTQELVENLPDYPPTIFCKLGAAEWVAELTSVYLLRTPANWQWRISDHKRDIYTPGQAARTARGSAVVHYFGWKTHNGCYHKAIDPVTMYGHRLDTIWPDEVTVVDNPEWRSLVKLLKWGVALRDFCGENNIEVRPTLGGMASQFLTDPRFYPNRRRKVPAKINQRTRENLPGNHYLLNVEPNPADEYTAHYLDQHRAHHYHALQVALPDSDHCFAYGRFNDLSRRAFSGTAPNFLGLYCLDLYPPANRTPFDWIDHVGKKIERAFVYSNELPHLLDLGYRVCFVRAAWGSLKRDTGLPKYAAWASEQLDRYGNPPWLKQFLLATYGTLATRPVDAEAIFRLASKGTPVTIRTGRRSLNGLSVQRKHKLEPRIAHLLQRGMIEAATRSESVGLSQYLDHLGFRVLSIYADAVIVECDDDKPLPLLPEPWRCKKTLSHLQFINQQAFTSDGMTKLPGVGRELIQYRQRTTPGYAPRVVQYQAPTGTPVQTDRRI